MGTKEKNSGKLSQLPEKYEAGFIRRLDKRTEVYQQLRSTFERIANEAGGKEQLTHTRLALIERFVFLEAALQAWEKRIVENPEHCDDLIGRWIQAVNSLTGLAKLIGLERSKKNTIDVKDYITARAS